MPTKASAAPTAVCNDGERKRVTITWLMSTSIKMIDTGEHGSLGENEALFLGHSQRRNLKKSLFVKHRLLRRLLHNHTMEKT